MNQMFDPFNLVLLAIALVIFWRLRSVLGSRTGNERPPLDPYGASRAEKTVTPEPANGNVIRLPKENGEWQPSGYQKADGHRIKQRQPVSTAERDQPNSVIRKAEKHETGR